jgi:hypothetical protein
MACTTAEYSGAELKKLRSVVWSHWTTLVIQQYLKIKLLPRDIKGRPVAHSEGELYVDLQVLEKYLVISDDKSVPYLERYIEFRRKTITSTTRIFRSVSGSGDIVFVPMS